MKLCSSSSLSAVKVVSSAYLRLLLFLLEILIPACYFPIYALKERYVSVHSNILAWEIPWTEEPGWLQSMGLQRVGHNLATKQ